MGIPYYFKSLIASQPGLLARLTRLPDAYDALFVDYNCVIHGCLDDADPLGSVLRGTRALLDLFEHAPGRIVLAIDGVVPMAKQVQQRDRRFLATPPEGGFDRNQISPGTPWMRQLEAALRETFPSVQLSDSSEPGEGEHKIMKSVKALPDGARVVIYGLDADLIILALQPACHTFLLRELQQFGERDCDATAYGLLDMHALRATLGVPQQMYQTLSFCFGNDFLPGLGVFSLRNYGFQRVQQSYKSWKPPASGCSANELLFSFFKHVQRFERANLTTIQANRKVMRGGEAVPEEYVLQEKAIRFHRPGWRWRYYSILFGVHSEDDIRKICMSYWRTIEWTAHYYEKHTEALSWAWAYPYLDAPLIEDLVKYYCESFSWMAVPPPSTTEQLQFILPARSWSSCGLDSTAATASTQTLAGYGGYLFKSFAWECRPRWAK